MATAAAAQPAPPALHNFAAARIRELRGHRTSALAVAWSCDGRYLASSSQDQAVRVYSHIERQTRNADSYELRGHTDSVLQLSWDPKHVDGLATVSYDKTVRLWDTRAGKATHTIQTGHENINVSFSPDGRRIVVGNQPVGGHLVSCAHAVNHFQDDSVVTIDTATMKIQGTHSFKNLLNELAFDRSGEHLFITAGKGLVMIHEFPSMQPRHTLQAHTSTSTCNCIDVDAKGRYFATGGSDALVALWDMDELICIKTFRKLEWPVRSVGFTHDGEYLAMASEDSFIDIVRGIGKWIQTPFLAPTL